MFCSNCGTPLPPNGVCTNCGVPATNMMFDGRMQGQPVVPQQAFYNPNPMYVQYQGPQQGYGQPYVRQENVAIRGIKDPKLVAGIGATIKNSCGSMMMVMAALLTTIVMIFSYIEVFYISASSSYDEDVTIMSAMFVFFVMSIPFTLLTIGMWMITFQGFGTYNSKMYNDNRCMNTSGFSTVQASAIVALVPVACITVLFALTTCMMLFVGTVSMLGFDAASAEDVVIVTVAMVLLLTLLILMIIIYSSIISQMAKIKHAVRGRNYERISLLLPVLLFILTTFQIIGIVFSAVESDIFTLIASGIYAIWYAFMGCTILYLRSRVDNYILRR